MAAKKRTVTKQTIDELLQEATIGQLKYLALITEVVRQNTVVRIRVRLMPFGDLFSRDTSGPREVRMPLNMNGRIRSFTRGQVKLLRSTGSTIVSEKAATVLHYRQLGLASQGGAIEAVTKLLK